jgi:hypothetical protein
MVHETSLYASVYGDVWSSEESLCWPKQLAKHAHTVSKCAGSFKEIAPCPRAHMPHASDEALEAS